SGARICLHVSAQTQPKPSAIKPCNCTQLRNASLENPVLSWPILKSNTDWMNTGLSRWAMKCSLQIRRGSGTLQRISPARPRTPLTNSLRSEEHTSELQSRFDLVCRLLLEKKKNYFFKCMTVQLHMTKDTQRECRCTY